MQVLNLRLSGLKLIAPKVYQDKRGFFFESYSKTYSEFGEFVQDNISFSKMGTIRGLHYQKGAAKLVTCITGRIWDVAVDIRSGSPTFGKWEALFLENQAQIFIPDGFAHGFCTVTEYAVVQYKVSKPYDPKEEKSIRWNDPDINIGWPAPSPTLSERDRNSPFFKEVF